MLDGNNIGVQLLLVIVLTGLILLLAYVFTRYVVGGRMLSGFGGMSRSGRLQLLEQLSLGREERIAVVQAGERYVLVGITKQSVTLLLELTAEEGARWEELRKQPQQMPTFKKELMERLKRKQG